jgi:acetyl-CoA carboxylase carboxyl transferase subunit alpha
VKEHERLRTKLGELRRLAEDARHDISHDIARLEHRLARVDDARRDPWEIVKIARHPDRPKTLDYVEKIFGDFLELHGDRFFGDDTAVVGGLATLEGRPVTVIGHQKGKGLKDNLRRNYGMAHPEGYRKALRLAEQAARFRRPVITFLDTTGAYAGVSAEERGIGESIARNLREFSALPTPIVVVVIGEGGSGGALGIGVGDRVIMLENAYYSVISPEGGSSIIFRDASRAEETARLLRLTSHDLLGLGVIDRIVPEPPGGAHVDPDFSAVGLKSAIVEALRELTRMSTRRLLRRRRDRLFAIGVYSEPRRDRLGVVRHF